MDQAIELLEKQIRANTVEMKIIAFEYIRCECVWDRVELQRTFKKIEQQNLALEKVIDKLLFLEA